MYSDKILSTFSKLHEISLKLEQIEKASYRHTISKIKGLWQENSSLHYSLGWKQLAIGAASALFSMAAGLLPKEGMQAITIRLGNSGPLSQLWNVRLDMIQKICDVASKILPSVGSLTGKFGDGDIAKYQGMIKSVELALEELKAVKQRILEERGSQERLVGEISSTESRAYHINS